LLRSHELVEPFGGDELLLLACINRAHVVFSVLTMAWPS
jgi:hypothetical protein